MEDIQGVSIAVAVRENHRTRKEPHQPVASVICGRQRASCKGSEVPEENKETDPRDDIIKTKTKNL